MLDRLKQVDARISAITAAEVIGQVAAMSGLSVEVRGSGPLLTVGDRIRVEAKHREVVLAEVVSFKGSSATAMTFAELDGIGQGSNARLPLRVGDRRAGNRACLAPSDEWLGRVINPIGEPLDGKGGLPQGELRRSVRVSPPEASCRARLGPRLDLGVAALNGFVTCRTGQRLGLFAGSGVGKSTLLSMLARYTECDVAIVALVGERGREVREFLEDDLGPDGLARSVVVAATSDSSPLMRREAAYAAMSIAEHFRDQGKSVLLLMDSVTRFCLALREIALSAGESPATRGYPPSVFAELPKLLERAGPGTQRLGRAGQITAFFTVLVEGDDHNEPIADAVRGILDGHVVMDRAIGERGRYPAVDILRSLSRTVPGCLTPSEGALIQRARSILTTYTAMSDLVRLGAYKAGSDPDIDSAIILTPRIEAALTQRLQDRCSLDQTFEALATAMEMPTNG